MTESYLHAADIVPLYEQLCAAIRAKIVAGEYRHGQQIPSETEMSKAYGVSRITVRSALKHLVDENILVKKHGKGTFVTTPGYIESVNAGGSFTKSCLQNGATPGTRILSAASVAAGEKFARLLGLRKEDSIVRIARLRLVDGVAVILEKDYFPPGFEFLLHADLTDRSLLEVLVEKTGRPVREFSNVFEIKPATAEQAKLLACAPRNPLLCVHQIAMTNNSKLMYFNDQFIRSDLYKYALRSS
jgi:Transcriptional regulators